MDILSIVAGSNQRGGRMLSIVDLLQAGTFSLEQAAWLLERILAGSSWLVGAKPGGAGKTTIMSALLAMLPEQTVIHLATVDGDWKSARAGECVVAYELSPGSYQAYLWGEDVGRVGRLGLKGCRVVSNLHADTLEEAREQIVDQCGGSTEEFSAFQLFLPIALERSIYSYTPIVEQIFVGERGFWREVDSIVLNSRAQKIASFLTSCRRRSMKTVEQVRTAWLAWLAEEGITSGL